MTKRLRRAHLLCISVALLGSLMWAKQVSAQDQYCGISAQTAQDIATEVIRLSGHEYDSVSQAYYVSVLASRLSPYYVIYFFKDARVVGEMEIDRCGRQDTPHSGLQYSDESDLMREGLLLEPDVAFAAIKRLTGREPVFGTRVFPYGLTPNESDLAAIDFWWMVLDEQGDWHYMTKTGILKEVRSNLPESTSSKATPSDKQ